MRGTELFRHGAMTACRWPGPAGNIPGHTNRGGPQPRGAVARDNNTCRIIPGKRKPQKMLVFSGGLPVFSPEVSEPLTIIKNPIDKCRKKRQLTLDSA